MVPVSKAVRVVSVGDDQALEWDSYVASSLDAELYHQYGWRDVIRDTFESETCYLMARSISGQVCGVLPLVRLKSFLFGDFLVSLPHFNYGGILAESSEVAAALYEHACDFAKERSLDHIELRHTRDILSDVAKRLDKVSMVLELPESEDALWRSLKPKVRAQIKRPQQEGASCEFGGVELLADFYSVFSQNMRDLGTPVHPKRLMEITLQRFPGCSRIAIVRLGGTPVAAGFVLRHRDRLEIPWASSLRRANPLGVNMMLYWEILKRAIASGAKAFDFGRSSVDSGTYRFKRQWGAQPVQLYWHYWMRRGVEVPQLNPQNARYRLLVKSWQRLPVSVANVIGPRIVKYLP